MEGGHHLHTEFAVLQAEANVDMKLSKDEDPDLSPPTIDANIQNSNSTNIKCTNSSDFNEFRGVASEEEFSDTQTQEAELILHDELQAYRNQIPSTNAIFPTVTSQFEDIANSQAEDTFSPRISRTSSLIGEMPVNEEESHLKSAISDSPACNESANAKNEMSGRNEIFAKKETTIDGKRGPAQIKEQIGRSERKSERARKPTLLFQEARNDQPSKLVKQASSVKKSSRNSYSAMSDLNPCKMLQCVICLKKSDDSNFLKCQKCCQEMHAKCAVTPSSSCTQRKQWKCPKCEFLGMVQGPSTYQDAEIVVEEVVWAFFEGKYLPASIVSEQDLQNVPVSVFSDRASKLAKQGCNSKLRLVQWIDGRKWSSYNWVQGDLIFDFIEYFGQYSASVKPRSESWNKISIALKMFPHFKPTGFSNAFKTSNQTMEGCCIKIPNQTTEGCCINLDEPCAVCKSNEREDDCLLCDFCDVAVHFFCIGLSSVPNGAWICPWCAKKTSLNSQKGRELLSKFPCNEWDAEGKGFGVSDSSFGRPKIEFSTKKARDTKSSRPQTKAANHLLNNEAAAMVSKSLGGKQNQEDRVGLKEQPRAIQSSARCVPFSAKDFSMFYHKLRKEYGFSKQGFHGEQDWLEGSLVGFANIPLPSGPTVVPNGSIVTLRAGRGLLQGDVVRREVIRAHDHIGGALKLVQYRLRDTSVTFEGPKTALEILQLFSRHIRMEVARNYVLSEILLDSIAKKPHQGANDTPRADQSLLSRWQQFSFSKHQIDEYLVDMGSVPPASTTSIPELRLSPFPFHEVTNIELEAAAEAALNSGSLVFEGFRYASEGQFEAIWGPNTIYQ